MGSAQHPNIHTPWQRWSEEQTLHVIAPYFNPFRFRTRRELFNDFSQHMATCANVCFWPCEIAFGGRPFEVTDSAQPTHIQLRSNSVLWYKENQINITQGRILAKDPSAKYFAYLDADVNTSRHDWAIEAIHQLQHYDWAQLFNYFTFESREHLPVHQHPSYAYVYNEYTDIAQDTNGKKRLEQFTKTPAVNVALANVGPTAPRYYLDTAAPNAASKRVRSLKWPGAPGLGWAWTRSGFDSIGGFIDFAVLGSADWHMALGLTGDEEQRSELQASANYLNGIGAWQKRAFSQTRGRIGYVQQSLTHHWHGDHKNRQYGTRWEILLRNGFDPQGDIVRDGQGLYQYAGNKPQLEREIYRYFLDRDDDSTQLNSDTTL